MFKQLPKEMYIEISGQYSIPIILLSIAIVTFASYTALTMNERMQQDSFFHKNVWLTLASISMGLGIWSMHFIGIGAYSLPFEMHYNPILIVVSIIPAVLSSFLAFKLASKAYKTIRNYIFSSILMGIGISTMHYIGMASMQSPAIYTYNLPIFIGSIFIGIFISFIALYIFLTQRFKMKSWKFKLLVAFILAIAASSMHYIGMIGTIYYLPYDNISNLNTHNKMSMVFINTSVILAMIRLLILLLLTGFIDKYVDYRINYFNSLTRIPNRRNFEKVLKTQNLVGSLAILQISDISKLNSEHGYIFGDKVIKHIGKTLSEICPSFTTLYQLKSRRFAFLSQYTDRIDELEFVMYKIAKKLKEPFYIEGKQVSLGMVCALSTTDEHQNSMRLYTDALAVLKHIKINNENNIVRFDQSIHTYAFEQDILNSIDEAMAENHLFMVYQPKVLAHTNKVVGMEALIRWQHPTYGMLSPYSFISILEKNQRIEDVTNWIIEDTCRQISKWQKSEALFTQVSINIPGEYLTSPKLMKILKDTIQKYNIAPNFIELEITETSVVKSFDSAIRVISTYQEAGFAIALDDFGTGVSSLSYLKRLPISTLKIDKSFIDDIPDSEKDTSILKAIIAIGRTLKLNIVIEGVETNTQVQFLTNKGDALILQGYYFSKPMPAAEFTDWYRRRA